jgi:UDP-N-acetylmuramoylalanine--D-glutamate ligase
VTLPVRHRIVNDSTVSKRQPLPGSAPRTLVVGLGATGLACVRHLARQGLAVAVTDSRRDPPGLARLKAELPDVAVYLGGFSEAAFAAAQRLVVSPGVALDQPLIRVARERGVEVLGDIELFARAHRAPVIAITGSNGKSTVTTLVGEMMRRAGLRAAVGGNLGTPALDLLPAPGEGEPDWYVLELSSFQLELTDSLAAWVATVLNLSADHLDRHGDLDHYAALKARVYRGTGVAVVNADDPLAAALPVGARQVAHFRLGTPAAGELGLAQWQGRTWLACGGDRLMPADQVALAGRHNLANALAALAVGSAAGLPPAAMREALAGFGGLPHRCQPLGEVAGVRYVNDSKGTNVGATVAAVQGLDGPLVLIAGGLAKGADFAPLRAALAGKVAALVLLGRDAPILEAQLAGLAPVVRAADMGDAVRRAAERASLGDTVLLSPACASQDMFADYRARGEAFARAVRALEGKGS